MNDSNDVVSIQATSFGGLAVPYINNPAMSDVILVLASQQQIYAHSLILSLHSEYFKAMLYGSGSSMKMAKSDHQNLNPMSNSTSDFYRMIELPEPASLFSLILSFMYGDRVQIPANDIVHVYSIAQKYHIHLLENECEKATSQLIDIENVVGIFSYALAFQLRPLELKCLEFITKNADHILNSSDGENHSFTELDEESFAVILDNDNLKIESELKLFKALLFWGSHQLSCNSNNNTNNNNNQELSEIISRLIHLIRFNQMNEEELTEEVIPLGIVPAELIQKAIDHLQLESASVNTGDEAIEIQQTLSLSGTKSRQYTRKQKSTNSSNHHQHPSNVVCIRCGEHYRAETDSAICPNNFFHRGIYSLARRQWSCCGITSPLYSGCSGRYHQWVPDTPVTDVSQRASATRIRILS